METLIYGGVYFWNFVVCKKKKKKKKKTGETKAFFCFQFIIRIMKRAIKKLRGFCIYMDTAISINVVGSRLQAKRQDRKVVWVVLNLSLEV